MPVHDLDLHRRDLLVPGATPVRLSVIDAGLAAGPDVPALVFIHGFGGYALQWKSQMLAFAGTHRAVAPDLRGHGLSDRPRGGYDMAELVGDLERVVECLGLPPRFTILGHSFGGAIAASYAVKAPERVERLVLIGTAVDFFAIHTGARLAFQLPSVVLEQVRQFFPRQLAAPAHVLQSMYRRAMSNWDGNDVMARIEQPTLVVMGERDEVFNRAAYDAVPDRIRRSQVVKVSVSAHLVHLERPEAVNRAIARFLRTPQSVLAAPARAPDELRPSRPWLRHYEVGVPHTLAYPAQPIHRLLDTAAQRFPRRAALVFGGEAVPYGRLQQAAGRFTNALAQAGVRPGDRVAVLLGNSPELVVAHFGAFKAGAVVVSLNPMLDPRLLARQIEDAGAAALVVDPSLPVTRAWPGAPGSVRHVFTAEPGTVFSPAGVARRAVALARAGAAPRWPAGSRVAWLREALERAPAAAAIAEPGPEQLALLEYSSGTTGEPKGAMLTHANLMANVVQVRHWLEDLEDGREVVLCALGLWHAYGATACTHLGLSVAATLVIPGSLETPRLLRTIARYRPTIFPGVPELFLAINDHPGVRRFDLKSIRACVCGAAPLHLEVQEQFERLTRGRLVEGYGLAEASPITHINPFYGLRKHGSIGVPLPDTDARIVDPLTGAPRPAGEVGELLVRGPQVMAGYWNHPGLTAQALRDGWLHTGDVACMDSDGFFRIVDRLHDVIALESGAVYPREVEEVLYEHTRVHEAAVTAGEAGGRTTVIAHVVLNRGETASAEELIAFCRGRLPADSVPSRIEFRDALPKTFMGKVTKAALGSPV